MADTRVTVLLPVFNGMPHLSLAISSILEQSYQEFVLLIINDGSEDGTTDYLNQLDDYRVQVIHQKNRGLGATLNWGIEQTKTEYLARMDADDFAAPGRLQKQIEFMDRNPEISVVGSQIEFFYDNPLKSGFPTRVHTSHEDIMESLLKPEHALCHATLLFRTAVLRDIGGYRISGVGEDWDMFLRLGQYGRLANLEECLYKVRIHEESVTWEDWSTVQMMIAFAVECAKNRILNRTEPEYEQYITKYQHRSSIRKGMDYFVAQSGFYYRRSIIAFLAGRRIYGALQLIIASLINPLKVIRRIRRHL